MRLRLCYFFYFVAGFLPAACLLAQDKIFKVDDQEPTLATIVKADDTTVTYEVGNMGSISLPRSKIKKVEIMTPASVQEGMNASDKGNFKQAISLLEPVYVKYRCLPQDWIEKVTARLGDCYLGAREWSKARELFGAFLKLYPQSSLGDAASSGEARALIELKQTDTAQKLLETMTQTLEKEPALNENQNRAMGRAFVDLGRCYAAANQNDKALEAFLKTTTVYNLDSGAMAEALYQSALIFEKMKNFPRAKGQLEDLLRDFPNVPFRPDAQKKLDSIKSSNPDE